MIRRCPINGIKFAPRDRKLNDKGWTYIEFNASYDLAFSRSESSRALTSFNVNEQVPCINRFTALSIKDDNYNIW